MVVDIETVPIDDAETALSPFIEHLAGKMKRGTKGSGIVATASGGDDKYQLALKKAALSPVSGKVVCIGMYELFNPEIANSPPTETWTFLNNGEQDEDGLLSRLAQQIRYETEFVTFNGRNFDFPFLMFRAAKYGIKLNLPIYPYNGRDKHYDMALHLNQISGIGNLDSDRSLQYISLNKWMEYFGIPNKNIPEGSTTAQFIERCVRDNAWDVLEKYCKNDVMATYQLFKQFEGNFSR